MGLKNKKSDYLANLAIYVEKENSFIIDGEQFKIKEGKVKCYCLVGENIIFSTKGQRLYKITKEKKCINIFQGDSNSEDDYTKIQTDFRNPNIFYASLNSKIFEFRIEGDNAIRKSKLDIIPNFDDFVISSNCIAILEKLPEDNEEDEEEEEEEEYESGDKELKGNSKITVFSRIRKKTLYVFNIPISWKIYVDNLFLYIYDVENNNVCLYPLDFTSTKAYTIIENVVKVIEGDQIGIQTSDNKILIAGYLSKLLDVNNFPFYSYIYKNVLYKVGPNINSPIVPSPLKTKQSPSTIEENVYFDNTNSFFFKRISKGQITCSKIVTSIDTKQNDDQHFLSQIMLQQDYYVISANKSLILCKSNVDSSKFQEKVLLSNMVFPVISLVSDLQESFSFFGLSINGKLKHYKIDISNLKLEKRLIETGVTQFCASFNYLVYLTFYDSIHIINRFDQNEYNGLPKESFVKKDSRLVKILNDDEFLYIFYKNETERFCYKYQINCITQNPTLINGISHYWRTSNNGSICIQNKKNGVVTCGKYTYSLNETVIGVAFSRGSFCIWKNDRLQQPEILTLFSNSLSTTFYNGYCCFFYNPNYDTFALRFNDDKDFYSGQITNNTQKDQTHSIRGTVDNSLSATVIGLNTIVFSFKNRITLFFVTLNEHHCYSININTTLKLLTNLAPHPNDMNSFFGIDNSSLYLLTYNASNIEIKEKLIMRDVVSYSVSKKFILIQFKDNSDIINERKEDTPNDSTNVFIYNLEDVEKSDISANNFVYSYCVDDDFAHVDKNLLDYLIDDNFFYVFKHQNVCNLHSTINGINSECKLYELNEIKIKKKQLTKTVGTYENVVNVFDSFQVIVVLSDNRFVFKNKVYYYQSDLQINEAQTLFAACQNEVMVWNTFKDKNGFDFKDPMIYKKPTQLKPIINCWFDGENALLFKRGDTSFLIDNNLINIEELSFLKPRFILKLKSNLNLIITNDQFIIYKNSENKYIKIKDVGMLASADSYRTDPLDMNFFFGHFKQNNQLYIIQYDREFYYRCYHSDVVKYDISRHYFVFIDTKGFVHCMKRNGEIPSNFENDSVDKFINDALNNDTTNLIPFIDDMYLYFLDPHQKLIRKFIIGDDILEVNPIENVVGVWSTDGVVIQTYWNDEYYVYFQNIQFKNKNNEKIFAAAIRNKNICVWMKTEMKYEYDDDDDDEESNEFKFYVANIDDISTVPDIKKELENKINVYKNQLNNVIRPIRKHMREKRKIINHSFDEVNSNLSEIVNILQSENVNKLNVAALNEMNDQAFVDLVKEEKFISETLNFGKTPPMYLLVLIRRIIHYMIKNDDECKNEINFWIPLFYHALSILPLDPITLATSGPFLDGFQIKISDLIDFIDSSELNDELKKELNKNLLHIDIILSSFSKKQI